MALKTGDKIPEILGKNQNGKAIKASDYQGEKLVLYFYPKDIKTSTHATQILSSAI
jgi:peroxiredoxin Q/BCP